MAQIAARGGGTPFGSGVVTVAELLSRNPLASLQVGRGSQTVISVAALLRREGRIPQDHNVEDVDAGTALVARVHARRVTARRGAIAAGTLLAAGSVVGAAVVNGVVSAPSPLASAPTQDSVGDAARSGFQAAAPVTPLTTLSQDAQVSPLDAGKSAPSSWMNVAFPDAVHKPANKALASGTGKTESGNARTGAAVSGPGGAATTAGTTTPGSTTQGSAGSAGSQSSAPNTDEGSGSTSPAASGTTTQPTGDSVTGRLGGAVTGLGSRTPLAPVTNVVGGVVTGVGDLLGAVVHGTAAR